MHKLSLNEMSNRVCLSFALNDKCYLLPAHDIYTFSFDDISDVKQMFTLNEK